MEQKYGKLLTPDIKLHRRMFDEMVKLLGINVIYYPPRKTGDKWTTYGELKNQPNTKPLLIGCLFEDHPSQQTLKKIGWVSELQENASIIHVAYDVPEIQQGALFVIPSGLDNAEGRVFRCTRLTNSIVYPASITCEIVPEYKDTYPNTNNDFKHSSFNILNEEDYRL